MNITIRSKITRVLNAEAAGSGDTVVSDSVDMKGFCDVTFIVALGACASSATGTVKAQQSSDDGSADTFADLLGTGMTYDQDSDNKLLVLEIVEPRERYVRCAIARAAANSAIDSVIAIQTRPGDEPVTQGATVLASELHASPAEGTA
ncbi:MAG: hypothetical protein ACWGMZ_00820 [Thermoguttaceae bacterium]